MKPLPRSTAKDVFLHLLMIGTLYAVMIAFISLYFGYVNIKFPDALSFSYLNGLDGIRSSMASLIVIWPFFLGFSWLVNKDLREEKEHREIGVRKWLLYLTLFFTSITIIVDLVTLVNYFLNGEITTRFLLKVLVVFVTAGAVFAYELWELKRDAREATSLPWISGTIASALLLASIVLGFFLVGTPGQQRLMRLDEQRVNSLMAIQNEVVSYYSTHHTLPATTAELGGSLSGFVTPTDPVTGAAFEYIPTSDMGFQLCATFDAASLEQIPQASAPTYGYDPIFDKTWNHGKGHTCFERTLDPAFYPIVK